MTPRLLLGVSVLALALSACGGTEEAEWNVEASEAGLFPAQKLFDQLKAVEAQFPLPSSTSTVAVGTLNAATGAWTGLRTRTQWLINPVTNKPYRITIPAATSIAGVNARLRFSCSNRGSSGFWVRIDGKYYKAAAGASNIYVGVGRDPSVGFKVACGSKSFSDTLKISRPNAYGAGAFEIPAFPFRLLYEPPTNKAKTNYAAYSISTQESSTVTLSRTTQKSDTRPRFSALSTITGRLLEVKKFLQKGSGPSTVVAGLDLATKLIGTTKTEVIDATTTQTEQTMEISTGTSAGMKTTADLGPGLGDIVGYLRRARFAWTMVGGKVEITLIDYDEDAYNHMVDVLSDYYYLEGKASYLTGPRTGLRRDAVEMLLKLDPFALGAWQADRFEYKKTIQPAGEITVGLSHTYKESDKLVETHAKSTVTQAHAGWLSMVGLGVTQSGKFTTTITQSQSRKTSVGKTVTASFLLAAQVGEIYSVDCYFDKLFGTFVFKKNLPVPVPSAPAGKLIL